MSTDNTEKRTNSSPIIWGLIIIGFCLLTYFYFFKKETIQTNGVEEQKMPLDKMAEEAEKAKPNSTYRPQYSDQNPRPISVDPFSLNKDFERMRQGNTNKVDFDFSFDSQKEAPTYQLTDGAIDFDLRGSVRTVKALESSIPLSIEIYNNDQISFTKRKKRYEFDLPFVMETKRETPQDKALYSFDFKQTLELDAGLHYFLIVPTGRNRVLYVGKFFVR